MKYKHVLLCITYVTLSTASNHYRTGTVLGIPWYTPAVDKTVTGL